MAEQDIKRVNFFDGQFLKQGEFLDFDAYHLHMRRRWGFVLFNQSGVVQATATDLNVEVTDVAQKLIRVRAGMAIGKRPDLAEAKEIVLKQDTQNIDLKAQNPPLQANDIAVVAMHYEEQGVAQPPSEGDVPGNTRILENAVITIHKNSLPGPNAANGEPFIRLGDVNFNTMAVDTSQRQNAFLRAALFAPTPQLSLSPNSVPATGNVSINVTSSGGLNLATATALSVAFSNMAGISNVQVTNQAATSMTLAFTLTNAAAGDRTVTVTVNTASASATLTIQAGVQLSGFAGIDEPNGDLLFKINGSGFSMPVFVEFSASGGGFANPINLALANVTATQLTIANASIPANATNGPVRVTSGGNPAVTSAFSVMPPPVLGVVPNSVPSQTNLTIPGSRFFTGASVTLPGNLTRGPGSNPAFPAAPFGESLSNTQIVVRVVSNSNTSGRVKVTTQGGTVQSSNLVNVT